MKLELTKHSLALVVVSLVAASANAQPCFSTTVTAPTPLMGNHGEILRTADGAIYAVVGSYQYLYAYYPQVMICASRGTMLVEGRTVNVQAVQPAPRNARPRSTGNSDARTQRKPRSGAPITVVQTAAGCDYFVADGPQGNYLLEWYGGHDPDEGDGILSPIDGYGFKDVIYERGQEGRVWVDDYLLSRDSALEKLSEKCN